MFKSLLIVVLFIQTTGFSQQLSYMDPAAAYQRILLETNDKSSYQQVGTYKVIGSPFLFGAKLKGDVYTNKERAENITLSYNTYNQQVEAYQANQDKPIVLAAKSVDSFFLRASASKGFKEDLLFINIKLLDSSSNKFFVQLVAPGKRFALFKAYRSDLGYVSTNYVQSELRQFDLSFEYYFIDTNKPGIKKLKVTPNNLTKLFSEIADISAFTGSDEFKTDPEYTLKNIFAALNHK